MVVQHWSLPTLSDLFYRYDCEETAVKTQSGVKLNPKTAGQQYNQALAQGEREWFAAIAVQMRAIAVQMRAIELAKSETAVTVPHESKKCYITVC